MSQRTGTVKFFNDGKGFGFIAPDDGGKDLFVHVTGLKNIDTLSDNQRVVFETEDTQRGKQAVNVEID